MKPHALLPNIRQAEAGTEEQSLMRALTDTASVQAAKELWDYLG